MQQPNPYGNQQYNPQQQQQPQQQPPYGQQPYGGGSQYGGSQMSFQQQQQPAPYGQQPPPQQQQQQYGSQYGGSQMNYNPQQQQQMQQQQQQAQGSQYGGSQASLRDDKYDTQNLNQFGGHKYGAYGSQLNFDNSAVKDSQRQLGAHDPNQQSLTESQMSLQDPNRKMKLKPLKWDKPLKPGKQKTQIFIWGKARPPNMFPAASDQITPWHADVLSKKKIWDVCAAREGHHCFGIGQNDWCFVWGETKQVGALGLGTNARATTPFLVRALRKQRVKQACCSAIHSLCITDQLVIYGWGSKALTLLDSDSKEPQPLNFLNGKGLKKLAAANTHSIAWNGNSIEVHAFGIPGPWLGQDDGDGGGGNNRYGVMKFDAQITGNDGFSCTMCSCSSQYSLVVLNTGYVGACGVNEHGRMGVGAKVQASAKVIWNRSLQNVVLCSAGSFHSGFVDTEGHVYTCGVGADFRLGHGDKETLWEPRLVDSCKNIQVCQIECVDARTFVITPQGNLIMWGKEPVTGRTHSGPFLYEYLNAYRIYDICGASDFCVAIGIRAKEPIPKPNVDNVSVDAMNPNVQVDNMNRLIGDVIQNYHQIGTEQQFEVDSVYSTFVKVKKTTPDESHQPQLVGKGGQGIPAPPMTAPPVNAVYGGNAGGPPPNAVYGGGGGMAPNMGGSQYGGMGMNPMQQQQMAMGGGGGSQYGGSQMQMGYGGPQQAYGSQMNFGGGAPPQQQQQQQQPMQYGGSQMSFNNGGYPPQQQPPQQGGWPQ